MFTPLGKITTPQFSVFLEKEKLKNNGSNFTDWFRGLKIVLRAGQLTPGEEEDTCLWGGGEATEENSSAGQTLAASLTGEAASTQGKGNGYTSHTQTPFTGDSVHCQVGGDLTDSLGCLMWDWVYMKGEKHRRFELCLW